MKIKASLVMPALAAVTVVAIVATGIALGQLRSGVPWVTLLGSTPGLEVAAEADVLTVADSDPLAADGGQLNPQTVQPMLSIQSAPAGSTPAVAAPRQEASTGAPGSGVSVDSRDSSVIDGGSDPETPSDEPSDEPLPAEDSPSSGVGDGDEPRVTVVDRSKDDSNVEWAAAQLAAADLSNESESASEMAEKGRAERAPRSGDD